MSDGLLTRAAVARRLNVSEMTVRRLGIAGHLTEVKVSERSVRITEASVDAWIAARSARPDQQQEG